MPKRSLNPGNGESQEDGAVEQGVEPCWRRKNGQVAKRRGGDRATRTHRGGLAQSAECEIQGTIEI